MCISWFLFSFSRSLSISLYLSPWRAAWSYGRYLDLKNPNWGDNWSHIFIGGFPSWGFPKFFLGRMVNARRSGHRPQFHFIIAVIMSRQMTNVPLGTESGGTTTLANHFFNHSPRTSHMNQLLLRHSKSE